MSLEQGKTLLGTDLRMELWEKPFPEITPERLQLLLILATLSRVLLQSGQALVLTASGAIDAADAITAAAERGEFDAAEADWMARLLRECVGYVQHRMLQRFPEAEHFPMMQFLARNLEGFTGHVRSELTAGVLACSRRWVACLLPMHAEISARHPCTCRPFHQSICRPLPPLPLPAEDPQRLLQGRGDPAHHLQQIPPFHAPRGPHGPAAGAGRVSLPMPRLCLLVGCRLCLCVSVFLVTRWALCRWLHNLLGSARRKVVISTNGGNAALVVHHTE